MCECVYANYSVNYFLYMWEFCNGIVIFMGNIFIDYVNRLILIICQYRSLCMLVLIMNT
jgi:hypothetical protein